MFTRKLTWVPGLSLVKKWLLINKDLAWITLSLVMTVPVGHMISSSLNLGLVDEIFMQIIKMKIVSHVTYDSLTKDGRKSVAC